MDYIFTNGSILNTHMSCWEDLSLLVQSGKIAHIGDLNSCRMAAPGLYEIVDMQGKLLLPAFTDTHTHFVEYAKGQLLVNLSTCNSLDEIKSNLVHYRENLPYAATWILGAGWDRNKLSNPQNLNRGFLDAIFPDMPVALTSKDYHAKICNSLALKLAGINEQSADPYGGRIERDASGIPTGVVFETATLLIDPFVQTASDLQIISAIRNSVQDCYKFGLAGFHSMECMTSRDLLLNAMQQGQLFRLNWHFQVDELDLVATDPASNTSSDLPYKTWGMKIFGDGSLGSQTAAMFAAYPDDPQNFGILRYTEAELLYLMQNAASLGYPCSIHAIGNHCVAQVIHASILQNSPKLKNRIEHLQSIRQQDIGLLKQSGMIAAVQPLHLANDVPMIEKHWHDIQDQVYSFATLLKAGIPLAYGSDSPIESINPCLGIYSAIERRPFLNPELPAFRPQESISVLQAIHGYTLGAAFASQDEQQLGSLDLHKAADLIVMDDFREQAPEYWLSAGSRLTMIAGTIVHNEL